MNPELPQFESGWALIDALPLSVYLKDRSSRFLYVNTTSALSLGLKAPTDAVGKSDRDFFEPHLAEQWYELEQEMMRSGKPIIDHIAPELSLSMPGAVHWILSCKYPFTDPSGQVAGLIGISKEIDHEHEELTRKNLAVRGAQVGLWHIKYLPNGDKEAWYSPRWKELLGYSDEEIPNRRDEFQSRVHPNDVPKVTEARNRYAANPKEEGHYECEFRMKHKTKGWIWIRSYGEAEFATDGTTCVAFAGSHTDITTHKDEHELHEEILSMLSALVFMKDAQKRFIFVNPELARYYGTTKEKMEFERERDSYYNSNKEQTDRFEGDDQKVLDDVDPEIHNKGLVIDSEALTNRATREIRQLKTTKKLFLYPSRDPRKHVLGISTDITDALKKTKDERDKLVEAHVRSRRFLAPLSSVQDLLDFRTKLPLAFEAVNQDYACIASGVLSTAHPGDHMEHVMQAYATQWKRDFLNQRFARVQGNVRKGVTTIVNDPLLQTLTADPPHSAVTRTIAQMMTTPLGALLTSVLPKPLMRDSRLILAAGASHGAGPKRLSDLITFFVLPAQVPNEDDVDIRSFFYFAQRFTESLAQYYRNSELYTERKEFLTDVTHQLVTPLVNTIDICTSAVEKIHKLSPEHVADRLYEARGLVRHCAMFTRAFLAASQSDQAQLVTCKDLNETSVKVTRLMIDVNRDFRVSAQTKGLQIGTDGDILDAIGFQEIDEEWVRHALMNVVDNAVKYTASRTRGKICLFGEKNQTEFALCVRNPSCIPIRPEYKDRIFDRWFRAPEAEQEEVQGTGIGLALAQAVVLAHRGRIEVEQAAQHDGVYETTFRLWFPSSRPLN